MNKLQEAIAAERTGFPPAQNEIRDLLAMMNDTAIKRDESQAKTMRLARRLEVLHAALCSLKEREARRAGNFDYDPALDTETWTPAQWEAHRAALARQDPDPDGFRGPRDYPPYEPFDPHPNWEPMER